MKKHKRRKTNKRKNIVGGGWMGDMYRSTRDAIVPGAASRRRELAAADERSNMKQASEHLSRTVEHEQNHRQSTEGANVVATAAEEVEEPTLMDKYYEALENARNASTDENKEIAEAKLAQLLKQVQSEQEKKMYQDQQEDDRMGSRW